MQVILLQDIPSVGKKHDIATVSDGFARNFLIPQKKAIVATPSEIRRIQTMQKGIADKKITEQKRVALAFSQVADKTFSIQEKTNESGGLFRSIGKEEISRILKEQEGIVLPPEIIQLKSPIKKSGEYKIELRDGNDKGTLTLLVGGEKEEVKILKSSKH